MITTKMSEEVRSSRDTLTTFFDAWKEQNWTLLAELCQITWLSKHEAPAKQLELLLGSYSVKFVSVIAVNIESNLVSCQYIVIVSYYLAEKKHLEKKRVKVLVIKESASFTPSEDGVWGVNPLSILKGLCV